MKEWPQDHPKAKAMARRRAAILAAAKAAFLRTGYAGTSMDAIAEAAGISLMTLYRHAESKDDLFAAVISGACDPNDEEERRYLEGLMALPLEEVLRHSAAHMQDILMRPDTIALMRIVIAEAATFPHLAQLAYDGFVAHFERITAWIMKDKAQDSAHRAGNIAAASRVFVDQVIGGDFLRALLDRPVTTKADQWKKAERACEDALRILAAPPRGSAGKTR